ncbi:50S ribosomal protein L34e [Candidatus Woesearchaeota archaeon]|nr:50S ribosomal protein L34e [Candidatus Woesearchaeota archaeon]
MVRRSLRVRSLRKIYVKTSRGVNIHFKERPAQLPKCSSCKTILKGIKKFKSREYKNVSKSEKKVNRPYGGNLCSKCMRLKIKNLVRGQK